MDNRNGIPTHIGEILAKSQLGPSKDSNSNLKKTKAICACGREYFTWSGATECNICYSQEQFEKERQEKLAELPGVSKRCRMQWLNVSNLPANFHQKTLENYNKTLQLKAYNFIYGYDNQSGVLLSPGVYGVGKTHLMAALINNLIETTDPAELGRDNIIRYRPNPVYFVTENELMRRIRQTFNWVNARKNTENYEETEEDVYHELFMQRLLIIDDVGKVRPRDLTFTQGVYFNIIDQRYSDGKPIILTTNLDFGELEEHIGGACADRLREMCGKDGFIKMTGKSYRHGIKDVPDK